jgi:aclacinomycin oxidase
MTVDAFSTLLRNFGTWHENNSAPGAAANGMYAVLLVSNAASGGLQLVVQMDAGLPNAQGMLDGLITAVNAGSGLTPAVSAGVTMPWLHMTTWAGDGEGGDKTTRRYKLKAGYLRRSYTDAQLATIYKYVTNPAFPSSGMLFVGYGGQVQAVAPGATAAAQRDVVMKAVFQAYWADESDDAANLAYIRAFYRDVYAETGGVPVPNEVSDGSYINYPDNDLADPAWNTSGVPWSTLYYKGNYPRLQRIKAKWDPRDIFHHTLSIELPS